MVVATMRLSNAHRNIHLFFLRIMVLIDAIDFCHLLYFTIYIYILFTLTHLISWWSGDWTPFYSCWYDFPKLAFAFHVVLFNSLILCLVPNILFDSSSLSLSSLPLNINSIVLSIDAWICYYQENNMAHEEGHVFQATPKPWLHANFNS